MQTITSIPSDADIIAMALAGKDVKQDYKNAIKNLRALLLASRDRYFAQEFLQYGAKSGQMYFEHALKGIYALLQHQDFIFPPFPYNNEASLVQLQVTTLAYLVHDLNKMPENAGKWNRDLWGVPTLQAELERLNALQYDAKSGWVDAYFPAWKAHLNDMMVLINGHSAIFNHCGQLLLSGQDEAVDSSFHTVLDRDTLFRLIRAMQMVDLMDLIHTLAERDLNFLGYDERGQDKLVAIHQDVLLERIRARLSFLSNGQVEWARVLLKTDSVMANIFLNQTIKVMQALNVRPFFICADGVLFFGSRAVIANLPSKIVEIKHHVGEGFVERVNLLLADKIGDPDGAKLLLDVQNIGTRPAEFVYQAPGSPKKMKFILTYLADKAPQKLTPPVAKSRKNAINSLRKYVSPEILAHPRIAKWIAASDEMIKDEFVWHSGKFAQSVYRTLDQLYTLHKKSAPKPKQKKGDPASDHSAENIMKMVLDALGIADLLSDVYLKGRSNSTWYNSAFTFILGDAIKERSLSMDVVRERLVALVLSEQEKYPVEQEAFPDPKLLLDHCLQLFDVPSSSRALLEDSQEDDSVLCSYCGKRMKGKAKEFQWKAQAIAFKAATTKFDDMQPGGGSKPYRNICPTCKTMHFLQKMLLPIQGKLEPTYAVFYFPSAVSPVFAKSFQKQLTDPSSGRKSFMIDIAKFGSDKVCEESVVDRKGYGFLLPNIPEEVAGSIHFPFILGNDVADTRKYWVVLENALAMATQLRLNVVVTKLKGIYRDLLGNKNVYLHEVPAEFSWILGGKQVLTWDEAKTVLNIMHAIRDLAYFAGTENDKLQFAYVDIASLLKTGILPTINYLQAIRKGNEKGDATLLEGRLRDVYAFQAQL